MREASILCGWLIPLVFFWVMGSWGNENMSVSFFSLTSLHNTLFCCVDTLVHKSVAPLCVRLCVLPDLLYHRGNGLWQKWCHGMPAAVSSVLCMTKEDGNTYEMDRDWNGSKGEKWKSGHVLFQQSDDIQVMLDFQWKSTENTMCYMVLQDHEKPNWGSQVVVGFWS